MILDDILHAKMRDVENMKRKIPLEHIKEMVKRNGLKGKQSFFSAVKDTEGLSIIGEVKKASPSKGVIRREFDPVAIGMEYFRAGVQAISVLTEPHYFQGSDEYLYRLKQALPLPILRKDFIVDIWQVYQSAYLGADAILLITSVLNDEQLKKFQVVASILGMDCLVEVHTCEDVERALDSGAKIIGINNRDLKTFKTDLSTTERLLDHIPYDKAVVSESGIKTCEDMVYLASLGIDAVLIGETFMAARSIAEKVDELRLGNGGTGDEG
jgi:indole-3-glycerol phosphate synthase